VSRVGTSGVEPEVGGFRATPRKATLRGRRPEGRLFRVIDPKADVTRWRAWARHARRTQLSRNGGGRTRGPGLSPTARREDLRSPPAMGRVQEYLRGRKINLADGSDVPGTSALRRFVTAAGRTDSRTLARLCSPEPGGSGPPGRASRMCAFLAPRWRAPSVRDHAGGQARRMIPVHRGNRS